MTEQPTPEPEEEERTCPRCGGRYDQLPIDSHIPVCNKCQSELSKTGARW